MTPNQYYQLRKHHTNLKQAKYLVKHAGKIKKVSYLKQVVMFKQKTGMLPEKYIERYDDTWK